MGGGNGRGEEEGKRCDVKLGTVCLLNPDTQEADGPGQQHRSAKGVSMPRLSCGSGYRGTWSTAILYRDRGGFPGGALGWMRAWGGEDGEDGGVFTCFLGVEIWGIAMY